MLFKIDKYIIKAFLPTFAICMFAVCGIYIVIDVIQKLDDFIEMGSKAFCDGRTLLCAYGAGICITTISGYNPDRSESGSCKVCKE